MSIHQAITELFERRGFPTEVRNGRRVGFFHGTGHGLGLEIHEYPRLQKVVLKAGQCLTVEPGLYYPGIGGRADRRCGDCGKRWLSNTLEVSETARNLRNPTNWSSRV